MHGFNFHPAYKGVLIILVSESLIKINVSFFLYGVDNSPGSKGDQGKGSSPSAAARSRGTEETEEASERFWVAQVSILLVFLHVNFGNSFLHGKTALKEMCSNV